MFNFRKRYKVESSEGDTVESHESFGLISISRVRGKARLFGSAISSHDTFFELAIRQSVVRHSLGRDWFQSAGPEIVRVNLSAAQFAELITTLNVGSGVPCTLDLVMGKKVESPPERYTEADKVEQEFESRAKGVMDSLLVSQAVVTDLLAKKSLSSADKKAILSVLEDAARDIGSNMPFLLRQFREAAEKVKTTAKQEVESYFALSLHRLGLESPHGDGSGIQILPSKGTGEDKP